MDFFLLSVVLLLLLVSFMVVPYMKMRREMVNLPPGPTPLPFIGSLWKMNINNVVKSLKEMNKTYGDIFTVYHGHQPYIVLCGYHTIKETLIDKMEEFSGRGPYPTFANFTKGDDIVFSDGEKWRQLRHFALITLRNFGMGKRSIMERIKEEVQCLVNVIREKNGSPIDLNDCLPASVSNVICSVVFGQRFDYSNKNFQKLVKSIQNNFKIMSTSWGVLYNIYPDIMDYIPGPHKNLSTNFQSLIDFVKKRVEENKNTLDLDSPRDYIDCFLIKMKKEEMTFNPYFNPTTLVMTTMMLFFAGTETTSATLRHGFLMLMKYPKIAEKVYREIDDVIGHNRSPSWEDKAHMPYTEAFIHEVQRYADVIPLALPHKLTKDTQIRGYTFLKGTIFIPFLTSVHYDKSQFRKPDIFDPGHFLDEDGRFKKSDALMAFSAGKRICPGETLAIMELFLYFTTILHNFTIERLVPPEEISITPTGVGLGSIPPTYEICLVPR
ncbi:cytochrome P450 2F2-like isoform 1-T2 [Discoglossus pictus]